MARKKQLKMNDIVWFLWVGKFCKGKVLSIVDDSVIVMMGRKLIGLTRSKVFTSYEAVREWAIENGL